MVRALSTSVGPTLSSPFGVNRGAEEFTGPTESKLRWELKRIRIRTDYREDSCLYSSGEKSEIPFDAEGDGP